VHQIIEGMTLDYKLRTQ